MPGHLLLSFFSFAVKKRNSKKHVVVEKHVRQLGEKSNRRIISRLDGTAVFGRERGRERVWGRFWFFLSFFLFLWLSFVLLMFGMKNNGHIFCPFRIF
jgi:hypothetical protein